MTKEPDGVLTRWQRAAEDWFVTHTELDARDNMVDAWHKHAALQSSTLTLLGSYDAGKSALVRRVLVDAGVQCPEWLTISARHETFEVMPVEVEGVLLRDTPGLSPQASDPRGVQNSERALAAASLTDVLIIVLPPQLVTGEIPEVRRVLDQQWPAGSLRFVISRFDEAGIDASGDPDGYSGLAAGKIRELRQALKLNDEVPIHVVAPDAWQVAADARQPDPAIWDDYRDWDGVAEFRASLAPLSVLTPGFRLAAGLRYWAVALTAESKSLDAQAKQVKAAMLTAQQSRKRNHQVLDRLEELQAGARAELDGELGSVLDLALEAGVENPDRLRQTTISTLERWFDKAVADLGRLLQDFDAESVRQMRRPGWERLESDLTDLLAGSTSEPSTESGSATATGATDSLRPRLRDLNNSLTKSIKEVRDVFAKRPSGFSAKVSSDLKPASSAASAPSAAGGIGNAERALNAGEVLTALGPTIVDIVGLVMDLRKERAQQAAERQSLDRIERKLSELQQIAGDSTFAVFTEHVEAARTLVQSTSEPVERLVESLSDGESLLQAARAEVDNLLQTMPMATP